MSMTITFIQNYRARDRDSHHHQLSSPSLFSNNLNAFHSERLTIVYRDASRRTIPLKERIFVLLYKSNQNHWILSHHRHMVTAREPSVFGVSHHLVLARLSKFGVTSGLKSLNTLIVLPIYFFFHYPELNYLSVIDTDYCNETLSLNNA